MTNDEKIQFANNILNLLKREEIELPVEIGTLNREFGIHFYKKCSICHPVYEYQGKYYIYAESNDGKNIIPIPFNKETLKSHINFY